MGGGGSEMIDAQCTESQTTTDCAVDEEKTIYLFFEFVVTLTVTCMPYVQTLSLLCTLSCFIIWLCPHVI